MLARIRLPRECGEPRLRVLAVRTKEDLDACCELPGLYLHPGHVGRLTSTIDLSSQALWSFPVVRLASSLPVCRDFP